MKSCRACLLSPRKFERHDKEILGLQQNVKDLTAVVQRLVDELQRTSDRETHERDKMQLRLENHLLSFERRLPEATRITTRRTKTALMRVFLRYP